MQTFTFKLFCCIKFWMQYFTFLASFLREITEAMNVIKLKSCEYMSSGICRFRVCRGVCSNPSHGMVFLCTIAVLRYPGLWITEVLLMRRCQYNACQSTRKKKKKKKKKWKKWRLYTKRNIAYLRKLIFGAFIGNPVNILYKSKAGCYRPVRVADGPITACYRFIKNASWESATIDNKGIQPRFNAQHSGWNFQQTTFWSIYLIFPGKKNVISCELSPVEKKSIFLEKIEKNVSVSSAELDQRVVNVKTVSVSYMYRIVSSWDFFFRRLIKTN